MWNSRLFVVRCAAAIVLSLLFLIAGVAPAQDATKSANVPAATISDRVPQAPSKVDVKPAAPDSEIQERIEHILSATGWFEDVQVSVRDGVVTLSGVTATDDYRKWAEELSRNTQDVAAVVNRINLHVSSFWDMNPARMELRRQWTNLIKWSPYAVCGIIVLLAAWWVSRTAARLTSTTVSNRIQSPLLQNVLAETIRLVVFVVGLYLVLHIFGLTHLAVTVIGGTGLLGLVLGIAFRDISENFLASIFLSVQPPFKTGDLVNINGDVGYVQSLTTRATVIMTVEGNHVQIPNSTVYKSTIRNFTCNPNRRESFVIGIGYKDDIVKAQTVAQQVLNNHPAVLKEPEPWVLVDSLGSAVVNLQVYFWMNGDSYSWLSVRSSIIRLVKQAFDEQGISMPFESRNALPPRETPRTLGMNGQAKNGKTKSTSHIATAGEGGLESDASSVQEQAEQSRTPEAGHDLLQPAGTDHQS